MGLFSGELVFGEAYYWSGENFVAQNGLDLMIKTAYKKGQQELKSTLIFQSAYNASIIKSNIIIARPSFVSRISRQHN